MSHEIEFGEMTKADELLCQKDFHPYLVSTTVQAVMICLLICC